MRIPDNRQYVLFGGTFVLANKLQQVADKEIGGLTTKQWFLLRNLLDMPADSPPTITQLAKETDTTRQNISKMLEALQKQGLVHLAESPRDRRGQQVEITPLGREKMAEKAAASRPFFARLFAGIPEEEAAQAAKVMLQMIDNLETMQRETPL